MSAFDDDCPMDASTILACLSLAHEATQSVAASEAHTLYELTYHIECAIIAAARMHAEQGPLDNDHVCN